MSEIPKALGKRHVLTGANMVRSCSLRAIRLDIYNRMIAYSINGPSDSIW